MSDYLYEWAKNYIEPLEKGERIINDYVSAELKLLADAIIKTVEGEDK